MPFPRSLFLILAVASISKVFAYQDNSLGKRDKYAAPPGGWNNPDLYKNVDWTSVFSNKAPAPTTTPTQASENKPVTEEHDAVEGQGQENSPSPSPSSVTTASNPPDSSQSSHSSDGNSAANKAANNGGGSTTSSTTCPPGCQMTIKFTDDSEDVDFTACGGGSPKTGKTKGTCICMNGGGVRVKIGTTDEGKRATLIEGNAAGLSSASYYDVSYVEGYSWPVVCWAGKTMSGSNLDLYQGGNTCDGASQMGDFCENPGYKNMTSRSPDQCWQCTLPSPFFAPASGAAYTYPQDDQDCASGPNADPSKYASPMATGGELTCCVGSHCPPNTMSAGGMTAMGNCNRGCVPCGHVGIVSCDGPCHKTQKRGLEGLSGEAVERPRSKKRHTHHRHAAVHGSV